MAKIETPKETVADIIAEMRMGNAGDFPFACMIGDPDTPEVIDFTTKKVVEPRKINIRRVTVSNLADRLEAAVKRERATCCNAAAMREALEMVIEIADREWRSFRETPAMKEMRDVCTSALSAPARNCDRFEDAKTARQAWLDDANNWDDFGSPELELHEWLLAPAAEQKGE